MADSEDRNVAWETELSTSRWPETEVPAAAHRHSRDDGIPAVLLEPDYRIGHAPEFTFGVALLGGYMLNRRSFVEHVGRNMLAVPTLGPALRDIGRSGAHGPLEPWLEGLTGRHRQFFDVGALADGKPLGRVANFIETYVSAYGLSASEINAIFGAHSVGLAFVLSDDLWSRFGLGEVYSVRDPHTGDPAKKNIFVDEAHGATDAGIAPGAAVRDLMHRGVRFFACNNSIRALSKKLAVSGMGSESALQATIADGLLPGVMIVPAMLIAGNRAQEIGITYACLS